MVKMLLEYTAQPLAGFNMLEQGAGELNLEGSVRLAKLVRTDLTSSTNVGASLLTAAAPSPQSTIAGYNFQWAQGLIFKYHWAKGLNLITQYQGIYAQGVLITDGVIITDGVLASDATMLSTGADRRKYSDQQRRND
jgi:hypothetical protein